MPRILALLLHHLGLRDHPEPWEGPVGDYFISDKELTCAYLAERGMFLPKAVEAMGEMLGFTIAARINGRQFVISKGYVEKILRGRVLRRGKTYRVEESWSAIYERMLKARVFGDADGTGYWIRTDDLIPRYCEHFKPMTVEEFREATATLQFDADGCPLVTPPDEETLRIARSLRKRD